MAADIMSYRSQKNKSSKILSEPVRAWWGSRSGGTALSVILSYALFAVLLIGSLFAGILLPEAATAQNSLYRDVKANDVGDIITVILAENISGSSSSDARSSSNAAGSAGGSISGNFLPFEPVFGSDANVEYGSDERNLANQGQLLKGNMSVQIIEVTPRGDLVVEGNRTTEINGEIHEMHLTGVVRPNDVNSMNQVLSYRVANANIVYQKQGGVEELTKKRGIIRRVVFTGVGVLLGAAILAREL